MADAICWRPGSRHRPDDVATVRERDDEARARQRRRGARELRGAVDAVEHRRRHRRAVGREPLDPRAHLLERLPERDDHLGLAGEGDERGLIGRRELRHEGERLGARALERLAEERAAVVERDRDRHAAACLVDPLERRHAVRTEVGAVLVDPHVRVAEMLDRAAVAAERAERDLDARRAGEHVVHHDRLDGRRLERCGCGRFSPRGGGEGKPHCGGERAAEAHPPTIERKRRVVLPICSTSPSRSTAPVHGSKFWRIGASPSGSTRKMPER